jgi:hypothetical protein
MVSDWLILKICCDVGESVGKLCALCGVGQATYSTQCTQLASRLSSITTVTTGQKNIGSENAVWPPDDGCKDARNMLRNKWLQIKSLIVASSWSHFYLLICMSSLFPQFCITALNMLYNIKHVNLILYTQKSQIGNINISSMLNEWLATLCSEVYSSDRWTWTVFVRYLITK